MTKPEAMLWQRLRADPQGLRFRRQHPVGPFVLDFYCPKAKLAIEVDGMAHDMGDQPEFDQQRSEWLAGHSIEVVRVPAREALRNPGKVADSIVRLALSRRS
jgi:very-short-patch-repair endonuclease